MPLHSDYLFRSIRRSNQPISYSYYSSIIRSWAEQLGLDSGLYGTHSMRRTKATLVYARSKNIRAVQLLLGHTKIDNTIRYLGIEIEDAIKNREKPIVDLTQAVFLCCLCPKTS